MCILNFLFSLWIVEDSEGGSRQSGILVSVNSEEVVKKR